MSYNSLNLTTQEIQELIKHLNSPTKTPWNVPSSLTLYPPSSTAAKKYEEPVIVPPMTSREIPYEVFENFPASILMGFYRNRVDYDGNKLKEYREWCAINCQSLYVFHEEMEFILFETSEDSALFLLGNV